MSTKITRATMKLFASSAGTNQLEEFGSLAGGTPSYLTPDYGGVAVAAAQSLSAWLEGWYGGVVGSNLPGKQDLNTFCYVVAYQLAYLFQAGVPEWDTGTPYFTGSIVQSAGVLYVSLTNSNQGNAVSSTTNWQPYAQTFGPGMSFNSGTASFWTFTISSASVTAGAVYQDATSLGYFTALQTIASATSIQMQGGEIAPTFGSTTLNKISGTGPSTLTVSSCTTAGTYTFVAPASPSGALRVNIEAIGGGGAGSNSGSGQGNGGDTTFNGILIGPGAHGGNGTAAGTTTVTTSSTEVYAGATGTGNGTPSPFFAGGTGGSGSGGGGGGASTYGSGGAGSGSAGGSAPQASYGAGGAGGNTGGGGGAGCKQYFRWFSLTPGNSYTAVVGAGGVATNTGGNGAAGAMWIRW